MLDLPDIRQQHDWDCGRAAVLTVCDALGVARPNVPATALTGIDPLSVEQTLWAAGLSVQSGRMTAADLRHHTRLGRPVIALVTEASGVGHWVTVAGLARGRVRLQCPGHGPMCEPVARFVSRWQDTDRLGRRFVRWGIAAWLDQEPR